MDDDAGGGPGLFVGRVQLFEDPVQGLLEQQMRRKSAVNFSDPSGLWGKFFAPSIGKTPTCFVPPQWANFFTAALLSPKLFSQTKDLLATKGLTAALDGIPSVGFVLPPACPAKNPPACSLTEIQGVSEKTTNPEQEVVRITELDDEGSVKIHDEMMNEAGQEGNVMMNESGQEEDMIQLDEPSPSKKQDGTNRKKNKPTMVVESQVRRSPRVKG
jgi:hypothetical protein